MSGDHRTFVQRRLPRPRNDGSRVWTTADVRGHIRDQADFAQAMLPAADEVIRRACADRDDRVRSPALEGGRGGGDEDGRVPQMVLAAELLAPRKPGESDDDRAQVGWREDPVRVAMRRLSTALVEIHLQQERLSAALAELQALDAEQARRLVEERPVERGASCSVCGRWIAGGTADPIRAGRCNTCYRYWVRHRREKDRSALLVEHGLEYDEGEPGGPSPEFWRDLHAHRGEPAA